MRRVVITGLGAITPVGIGVPAYWDAICAGRPGVGPLTLVDPALVPSKVGAQCLDFDAKAALGEAFEELKKVELLDERDQARERAEENARDQMDMDSIGLMRTPRFGVATS